MRGRPPKVRPELRLVDTGLAGGGGDDGGADESRYPPAPDHLGEYGAAEWNRVVPELVNARRWLPSFQARIEQYCTAYQRWRHMEDQMRALGGEVVKSPKGYPIQSPFLSIANKQIEIMTAIADRFGFDMVAQVRLAGAQLDLFAGHGGQGGPADPVGDKWRAFD